MVSLEKQEAQREIYALIGLVAVQFARLEANLTDILGTLIHPNNDLLTATLTENIGFAQKLDLIKKVGRLRSSKEEEIKQLVSKTGSIRKIRNEFIHGIWRIEANDEGKISASCQVRRIKYEKKGAMKKWRYSHSRRVSTDELNRWAYELDELCRQSEKLAEELKENQDFLLD